MRGVHVKLAVAVLSFATVSGCVRSSADSNGDVELAFRMRENATASDAGLPTYPGARPYKEGNDSSSAANIGVATPWFDFKVVALKLESTDSPKEVARFYHRAMSKYGEVIDCSDPATQTMQTRDSELVCDSSESSRGEIIYKVGTGDDQRVVAIKPHGRGTRFNLVHVGGGEKR